MTYIHPTAEVSEDAIIDTNASIWRFSIIQSGVIIGANTIIGSNVYVGAGVTIGSNCKIQNGAQIFEGSKVGDGVFIGPGVILTNDKNPRAITDRNLLKTKDDWTLSSVEVCNFASIGAGTICIAPLSIGEWALVGAGSVLTKSVLPFEYGFGNPYLKRGWVGKLGKKLESDLEPNFFSCSLSKDRFVEIQINGEVRLMEIE